ncbi:MAG: serine/threonine-protein kinase, partial [Myxococcota bacterium]
MTEDFDALLRELARAPKSEGTLPMPGSQLGPYRIDGILGQGGMGCVYRAFDTKLHRPVALKVLLPETERQGAAILAEARLAAAVRHPHVVTIYEVGEHEEVTFLAMELLEGPTLRERLEAGALSPAEALTVARDVASAMDAAHRASIVHRDLKPENVGLDRRGRALVLDFGIATVGGGRSPFRGGTPRYMAPELEQGAAPSPRSDVYAFGVLLREMLLGLDASTDTPIRDPKLDALIRGCLAERPRDRFPDGGALLVQLGRVGSGPRPRRRVLAGLCVAAAGALLSGLVAMGSGPPEGSPPPRLIRLTHNSRAAPVLRAWLAPTGARLLYEERRGLFTMDLPSGTPRRWTRVRKGRGLVWHPESDRLVRFEEKQVSLLFLDGSSETVGDAPALGQTFAGYVGLSPDAAWVSMTSTSGLSIRPLRGESWRWLARPPNPILPLWPPVWSPDGRRLAWAYVDLTQSERVAKIAAVEVASGRRTAIAEGPRLWLASGVAPVAWRSPDHLLYVRSARVPSAPYDTIVEATLSPDHPPVHSDLLEVSEGKVGSLTTSADGKTAALVVFDHAHTVLLGRLDDEGDVSDLNPFTFSDRHELPSSWDAASTGLWLVARDETGARVVHQSLDGVAQPLPLKGALNTWPVPSSAGDLLYFGVNDGLRLERYTPDGEQRTLRRMEGWQPASENIAPPRMVQLRCARTRALCLLARAFGDEIRLEAFEPQTGRALSKPFSLPNLGAVPRFDLSSDGERILVIGDMVRLELRDLSGRL